MATASRLEAKDMEDSPSVAKQVGFFSLRRHGLGVPTKAPTAGNKRNHEKTDSESNEVKRRKLSEENQHQNSLDINAKLRALQEEITEMRQGQLNHELRLNELTSELANTSKTALEWQRKAIEAECKIRALEDKAESTAALYKGVIKELLNHEGQKLDAMREQIMKTRNIQAVLAREISSLRDENVSNGCDLAMTKMGQASGRDDDLVLTKHDEIVTSPENRNKSPEPEEVSSHRREGSPDKLHPARRVVSPTIEAKRLNHSDGDDGQGIEEPNDLRQASPRDRTQAKDRNVNPRRKGQSEVGEDTQQEKTVDYDGDSSEDLWQDAEEFLIRHDGSDSDGEGTADARDLKNNSSRDGRRNERFFQRSTMATKLVGAAEREGHPDVPILQYLRSLVVNLGPEGMSSDESDIEDGENILDVHKLPYRQDVTNLMDYLDLEYEETMKPLDAENSTPRRIRRNIKDSNRPPFEDKDEALFNPSWLSSGAQMPKTIKKGTFTWSPIVFRPLEDFDE